MSLYRKLGLFILVATALPLVLVGLFVAKTAEDALRVRIQDAQIEAVRAEAAVVGRFVDERVEALSRAASYFKASELSPAELEGTVKLLYKAEDSVAVAALVDESGAMLAKAAYLEPDEKNVGDLGRHPRADKSAVERLLRVAPRERALKEGPGAVVLSSVYGAPERSETAYAVALVVEGPDKRPYVYLAEVSLAVLLDRAKRNERSHGVLEVVDADGRIVAGPDPAKLTMVEPLFAAVDHTSAGALTASVHGKQMLAAHAGVPIVDSLGWTVLASLPEDEAFAPIAKMRLTLGAAVAGVTALLLLLSAFFVRDVRKGLGVVVAGAEAFSQGKLDHRIAPPPEQELRDLAVTFNRMGDELSTSRAKLERWNEELEATVDARTKELKEAQARLLETQKLAAVGHLGAGVAHEINNPLAAVLGGVQNMVMKKKKAGAADADPDLAALAKIEKAARRCRDVTTTLLRFSQRSEEAARMPVALNSVVTDAVSLSRAGFEEMGAQVDLALAEPSPVVTGDAGQLVQVLVHLLSNAKTALLQKQSGTVAVRTEVRDGRAVLVVSDDGKGIDPAIKGKIFEPFFTTKDVWTNLGLGLSESFRIVEDHGGRIEVLSELGRGTTVTVVMPCDTRA